MKSNRVAVALLVSAVALQPIRVPAAEAQAAAPTAQAAPDIPTFGVGTAAVTLDVVVRDKKGRAVHDLEASDFEVYEDGVKQQVDSFQIFGRPVPEEAPAERQAALAAPSAPATAAAPPPAAAEPESETRAQVIAFVFDRLSPDARHVAQKAATTYLERGHVEGDLVGVFAIDLALRTIQPFTRDTSLIRTGLQRAASQANTAFDNARAQSRDLVDVLSAGESAADAASGANPGQGSTSASVAGPAAAGALNAAVSRIQLGMLRQFEVLERDQQGYASTNGLLSVVSGLKSLPGRKTVVFFSEGLSIPPNVQAQFRSVIHTANRSNVSVYAMDAAGLRTDSMSAETRKEMLQAAERRVRQLGTGRDDASDGPMTGNLERNEDLLRLNPESGLGQLANETGGFLIRDTNDAASAFRRIEEDMRFHYLLAYSPSNENYDGKFRSISVKVNRPGLKVQTRQGYFAVRATEATPLRSFEAPALVQLDRKPQPHDFPVQAAVLSFPTTARPGLAPVLVRVPGQTIAYVLDKQDKTVRKMHRADLTVVARVKDQSGREVDRLSQHYALSAPAEHVEAARRGEILFYREAELAPGRYTVEAVAYDAMAQKAGVSTAVLEVPAASQTGPRLSSIVLVGRADKVSAAEQQNANPFYFGETIIYPNMGEPFRKVASPAVGFFFTVYGVKEAVPGPKATIEIYKGEQRAGQVTADLPAPDATGRVQYAGALPLQSFAAGTYTLKVTATTAAGSDSRQASFTVTE
jgi:VWFA-related protein